MRRNTTGRRAVSATQPLTRPAAGAPTVYAPGGRPARPPAALQTTTDVSQQNNTGPLGGPAIKVLAVENAEAILCNNSL